MTSRRSGPPAPVRISFVLGTRPEVIKLAPVILEAKRRGHEVQVVMTGQHRHLTQPLLEFFEITPDLDLDVMAPNQTLTSLSAKILGKLDERLKPQSIDVVVVQGDTTSAWIAGYWAFCHRIPVAHVEAGLRTHDLASPFPEEANRQLIGRIADLHFAPTQTSAQELKRERRINGVSVVGNTSIDALHYTRKKLHSMPSVIPAEVLKFITKGRLVLVTAHRRESFGDAFAGICEGILALAESDFSVRIVYPMHPNPQVREPVQQYLSAHPRILLCEPLDYVPFVALMEKADLLLTDSGGIQEEGPTLKKPILVMRKKTERPEGVRARYAVLVGTDPKKILKYSTEALKKGCLGRGGNPYGDGKSAERILSGIEKFSRRIQRERVTRRVI